MKYPYGAVYVARQDVSFLDDNETKRLTPVLKDHLFACKIGYCQRGTDPKTRLANLQTGNAIKMNIEAFHCMNPQLMEKYCHQKWAEQWLRGEWYKGGPWQNHMTDELKMYQSSGMVLDPKLWEELKSEQSKRRVPPERDTIDGGVSDMRVNLKEQCDRILEKHRTSLMNKYDLSWRDLMAGKREKSDLKMDEFKVVLEALQTHPEATEIIGVGLKSIFVAKTFFGSYCFHVMRKDGSEEEFSYGACFSGYNRGAEWHTYRLPSSETAQ